MTRRIKQSKISFGGSTSKSKTPAKDPTWEHCEYMTDEVKDSDEDEENDSDNVQGHGDYNNEDDDTDSVEADNNHDNEDEGDVAVSAECIWNDKCQDNYDSEDNSWELNIVTTGCLLPQLKSVFFQEFAGNPREMKWVRLILKYAKALQKKEYPLLRSL